MKPIVKYSILSSVAVTLCLVVTVVFFLFTMRPISFIEGDTIVQKGKGFGFSIGMSKTQSLQVIQSKYADQENILRVRDQDTGKCNEYFIAELQEHIPALQTSQRWDIRMPAQWVNDIYLEYSGSQLTRIMKSRWLYERP